MLVQKSIIKNQNENSGWIAKVRYNFYLIQNTFLIFKIYIFRIWNEKHEEHYLNRKSLSIAAVCSSTTKFSFF